MASAVLRSVMQIPASPDKVWRFFSSPSNLQQITPTGMGFRIISPTPDSPVYTGQVIEYKIRVIPFIPFRWLSVISAVDEGRMFVDEQVKGPYRFWHHEHHFREIPGGVEMKDLVTYVPPFGFIGQIANSIYVRNKLMDIFRYRHMKIREIFGTLPGGPEPDITIS